MPKNTTGFSFLNPWMLRSEEIICVILGEEQARGGRREVFEGQRRRGDPPTEISDVPLFSSE